MNRNQLVVLWCGIALIAAMCLYVPWIEPARVKTLVPHFPHNININIGAHCGYSLIFLLKGGQRIDAGRLGLQCGLVAVVAAGLMVTFRNPVKRS